MPDEIGTPPEPASADVAGPVGTDAALSPAAQRFDSCRWRQVAEDVTPAHCTHRDVVTIAGVQGFKPDSWCEDCSFFKIRRNPRKRPVQAPEDRYYY